MTGSGSTTPPEDTFFADRLGAFTGMPVQGYTAEDDLLIARAPLSQRLWRNPIVRSLVFNPVNFVGVLIILGLIFLALVGDRLAPYSPITPDYNALLSGPSGSHLFGTDYIGYDIFSRVLAGARLSFGTALAVLAIAVAVGIPLGAIAGYAGGWIDEVVMRVTDMFLAFPALILALVVAASLGPGLTSATIALSIAFWPWYARLVRGQVLGLKGLDFVHASRALGVSSLRLMWRHILPNAGGPIIIELSLDLGYAILATASLSFIGLGAQPPSPEWGAMIVSGRDYLHTGWWISAAPGVVLTLAVLGFNLVGDGLRDALDPRSSRRL